MDESGPTTIEASATFNKDQWFETPETAKQTFTYANGVTLLCSLGRNGYPGGTTFEGEKGTVHVNRGSIAVTLNGEKVADPYKLPTGDTKLYVSDKHHQNWLDCVQSREVADLRRRDRSPQCNGLPPRKHRYPDGTQDHLGREGRADR